MIYLDTSLLVAAFTVERDTERVQDWMRGNEHSGLTISDWVVTEFAAALSRKQRMELITAVDRDRAWDAFDDFSSSVPTLLVSRDHFRNAADHARRSETGLRGGNALHLAIASQQKAMLSTLDKTQAKAGDALGIGTLLV